VTWREGGNGALTSRFAATRVRPAHRDDQRREPQPELRLLVEWPEGEPEPTKFWFANLACSATTTVTGVDSLGGRWLPA
jgi:SRSO17 transposase